MLAARNRWLRIAAALAGVAWLLLAGLDMIDTVHVFGESVRGGYDASEVLFFASHLIGAVGWFMVASAFGTEVDWGPLWAGATIVATTYGVFSIGWIFRMFPTLAETHDADFRGYTIALAIGAMIFAAGTCVAASGFREKRRGEARSARLQIGVALTVAALVATTIGLLSLQSYYSSADAVHEASVGALLQAIGTFITAAAALVFAAGARRPLADRERAVVGASVVAVFATVCLVAGEGLVAYVYSSNGGAAWQQVVVWLAVASRLFFVAVFVALGLGARTVRDDSGLGVTRAA